MQQTSQKEIQNLAWRGGKSNPLATLQEIEIWPYYKVVYTQTRILKK